MPSLNMQGPFLFTSEDIDRQVNIPSVGVFALGYLQGIDFVVIYIGRAEEDLRSTIKTWLGKDEKYKMFKYCYTVSPHAAYERQCKNYHEFGGQKQLHNMSHPAPAEGTEWSCPFCQDESAA